MWSITVGSLFNWTAVGRNFFSPCWAASRRRNAPIGERTQPYAHKNARPQAYARTP